MTDQSDLLRAAQELGAALNATPEVQAYLRAKAACDQDEQLRQITEQVEAIYAELTSRQRAGEMLVPREVNEYYRLRDQLNSHPLVQEREQALAAVKAIFEQAGSQMSSILSVDYTLLAEDTDRNGV